MQNLKILPKKKKKKKKERKKERKKRKYFTKDFFEGVYYKAFNCCY